MLCIGLIVAAFFAAPFPWSPPFNFLTPDSRAIFIFTWQPMAPSNNYTVSDAYVEVQGKGGLSANNPLRITLTWYINNRTLFDKGIAFQFKNPILRPIGAYAINPWTKQVATDDRGFPMFVNITLHRVEAKYDMEKWTGSDEVIYYQGGVNWGFEIILDNQYKMTFPNSVYIVTEDVAVVSRTNALVTSFTLVFLAVACFEFRKSRLEQKEPSQSK